VAGSKLAVGLPVFNGENFLRETLAALGAQTLRDFSVTVADNASTDATPVIVAEQAPGNARVHVLRQSRNLGAAPNYNAAYRAAPPSEYFAWVAHDDLPQPRFFEACVAALDAHPEAVVAFSRTAIIDPQGERIGEFPDRPLLASPDRAVRLGDVLRSKSNHPIFGVIRRSALDRTRLHASYTGSDRTLLVELALQGPFIEIPEALFHLREHPQRSVRRETSRTRQTREAWFDSSRAGKIVFPHWHRLRDYVTAGLRTPMPLRDRFRCLLEIGRVVAGKEWKPMGVDLVVAARQLAARFKG
jgi:glycosyltransferase involved in cell wall biosynthesis